MQKQESPSLLEKMSVVPEHSSLSSSIEFAFPLHKWIRRCRERVKKTRGENERRERGLFIERGRKPECAADKEQRKREK